MLTDFFAFYFEATTQKREIEYTSRLSERACKEVHPKREQFHTCLLVDDLQVQLLPNLRRWAALKQSVPVNEVWGSNGASNWRMLARGGIEIDG